MTDLREPWLPTGGGRVGEAEHAWEVRAAAEVNGISYRSAFRVTPRPILIPPSDKQRAKKQGESRARTGAHGATFADVVFGLDSRVSEDDIANK